MNQFQLMQQNLAKLINQHSSMPNLCQEEPADPFQKIQFGKKNRKSKINFRPPSSQEDELVTYSTKQRDMSFEQIPMPSQKTRIQHSLHEENCESPDIYVEEMKSLFRRLKGKINEMENFYLEEAHQIKKVTSEAQYSELMDNILGHLEGSVEFIVKDCLKAEPVPKDIIKVKNDINRANKENIRNNNVREIKEPVKVCHKRNKSNEISRARRSEKSIYEAVLEEREQRRRKRMV